MGVLRDLMAGRGATPPPEDLDVRHVQPYQATKTYRCPGCDHEIAPGVGHEVVVPVGAPDLRRHWHTPCWQREQRRRHGRRGPAQPPRLG